MVGSVFGAILTFLSKLVGFLDKNTRALTVFLSGFVGLWLTEKVKKNRYYTELGWLFVIFVHFLTLLFDKLFHYFFCVFVYTDDFKHFFRVAGIKFCKM